MANILQLVGPLVLLWLSVPLASLAIVTTTLAFSTLFVRVSIVYFELGTALMSSWLFDKDSTTSRIRSKACHISSNASTRYSNPKKRRRSSAPQNAPASLPPPTKSQSFASLVGSSGPTRDFEGVGGWRLAADTQNEYSWTHHNSRLQLANIAGDKPRRRHQRSLSSQGHLFGSASSTMRLSPATSRNRTPTVIDTSRSSGGYFDFPPTDITPISPEESAAKTRMKERRQSLTSGSGSSVGSVTASISLTQPVE